MTSPRAAGGRPRNWPRFCHNLLLLSTVNLVLDSRCPAPNTFIHALHCGSMSRRAAGTDSFTAELEPNAPPRTRPDAKAIYSY